MFKYSSFNYDQFYSTEQCEKENREIKHILDSVCKDGDSILDLGAGTGLVYSMVGDRCHVTQIEKDPDMQALNPFPNFICSDAKDALDSCEEFDHAVSLFALDYMKRGTLTEAVKKAKGDCVFVIYDKPYKSGSASIYKGKKMKFLRKCYLKMKQIDREIDGFIRSGYPVSIWNLCGEPYYKVIMIGRK